MEIIATALAGLQAAEARVEKTARNVARGLQPTDVGEDRVDLSAEMVALIEAKNGAAVNVKVVQTAEDLAEQALKIV